MPDQASRYARTSGTGTNSEPSKYARRAGQSATRELTRSEDAIRSMRRGAEKAEEYRDDIVRLRAQVERQRIWLDSPDSPDDAQWDQRFEIHCDRWQQLEQTIANLTGWVAIHLAEAGRMGAGERKACESWVRQLYEVERWIEDERLAECVQYPNGDDPVPF